MRKATDVANAASCGALKMVASTAHSFNHDLEVNHYHHLHQHHLHYHYIDCATTTNQQQQSKCQNLFQHPLPPPSSTSRVQTSNTESKSLHGNKKSTQDKRSRLSNVINNLLCKKVPIIEKCESQAISKSNNEIDKYKLMMTVLNGCVTEETNKINKKDNNVQIVELKINQDAVVNDTKDNRTVEEDVYPTDAISNKQLNNFVEPNEANEGKVDAAVPLVEENKIFIDDSDCSKNLIKKDVINTSNDDCKIQKEEKEEDEVRKVCKSVIDDLIDRVFDLKKENNVNSDLSSQSLQCSLPLDKVASILDSCQTTTLISNKPTISSSFSSSLLPPPPSVTKNSSPSMRHLCLFCERKFSTIVLRQRHTELIHQASTNRRSSERNPRKFKQQSCQYCVDDVSDSLESLFRHMIDNHSDKYHGCLQCSIRYQTKDNLTSHVKEIHNGITTSLQKIQDRQLVKSPILKSCEDNEESAKEKSKPKDFEGFDNPEFYRKVIDNIQENLLHHLDGKIQGPIDSDCLAIATTTNVPNNKLVDYTSDSLCSIKTVSQYPLSIDISLTAVTPVQCNKERSKAVDLENSSELADKPEKSSSSSNSNINSSNSRLHVRRLSYEKFNFPCKYDNKKKWSCTMRDLSKFDLSTQLTLKKKQQLINNKNINFQQLEETITKTLSNFENNISAEVKTSEKIVDVNNKEVTDFNDIGKIDDEVFKCEKNNDDESKPEKLPASTIFSNEFENFMRVRENSTNITNENSIHAEFTGEWSRPRVYICAACADRHVRITQFLIFFFFFLIIHKR